MATQTFTQVPPRESYFSWASIFAGTFVFLAIEATFGVLGAAVFASAVTPSSNNPVAGGTEWGFGIWMVVLSIIALYFGGKTAGKLSGTADRNRGMYQGLTVFGMSIFTSILVTALVLGPTVRGGVPNPGTQPVHTVADVIAVGGYWLFVGLVLSMIAAAIGGAHGAQQKQEPPIERRDNIRQVA